MVNRRIVLLCLCVGLFLELPSARSEIQVGAAVRIITPDPLLPVSGGIGTPQPAKEKRGDLTARALVLRKADVSVGIVALDLLGFPSVLGDRVRAKVPRIPATNILIASTHTHSAPDCYAFPDGTGGHTGDLAYMSLVCDRAAEALNAALDRLEPAVHLLRDDARVGHRWDGWPQDVGVEQPDLGSGLAQRGGDVHRHRRLTDAALA